MISDEDILTAAKLLRQKIEKNGLTADAIVEQLDILLMRAGDGEQVGELILRLLASSETTRDELRWYLGEDDVARTGPGQDLPGLARPSDALYYECLVCGYETVIFEVGELVGPCPHGHGRLSPKL